MDSSSCAIKNGSLDVVNCLIEYGVVVNAAECSGGTALMAIWSW